jgi:hypothetical protein
MEKAPEPQPGPFHFVRIARFACPGTPYGVRGLRCAFRSRTRAAPRMSARHEGKISRATS